jgi:tyrosine-protein kinase Etk/Wzc
MNTLDELNRNLEPSQEMAALREPNSGVAFGVTLIEILTQLAMRKWWIASVTGAAIVMGLFYGLMQPTEYTSVTKIMPPKQTQSTTSLLNSQMGGGSLADVSGGGLSLKDPNAIYIGLLQSRPIADAIIRSFDLTRAYGSGDMTAARRALANDTRVISERSGLISISVTSRDKKRAAAIANAYTAELRVLTKTISVTEASKRRLFFEEQLNDAKEGLIAAEESLQQVQQNKGLVHLDSQAGVLIGSLAAVRGEIAAKQVELEGLRSYSTEHNPDVQLAEKELSTLQGEAARMEHHGNSSAFSESGLEDIPKAGLDYVRAQRELQYRQAYFDLLLKQYEAARLDEGKDAAVIQVVEPAIEPDRKSSPQRMLILAYFAIAGFFVACLVALGSWCRALAKCDPDLSVALTNLSAAVRGLRRVRV